MIYYIVWQSIKILAIVFFRIRTYGKRNVPVEGGALLASNHQSYLDPAIIGLVLNKPIYFLARKELYEANKLFGWFLTKLNTIPLERRGFDSTGLRRAIEVLQKGGLLVVFPEGTRTSDGRIGEVKKGIGLLGIRANVPLIPTLIDGAYQSWPRNRKFPIKPEPITVRFDKPIWLGSSEKLSDSDNISILPDIWKRMPAAKKTY